MKWIEDEEERKLGSQYKHSSPKRSLSLADTTYFLSLSSLTERIRQQDTKWESNSTSPKCNLIRTIVFEDDPNSLTSSDRRRSSNIVSNEFVQVQEGLMLRSKGKETFEERNLVERWHHRLGVKHYSIETVLGFEQCNCLSIIRKTQHGHPVFSSNIHQVFLIHHH